MVTELLEVEADGDADEEADDVYGYGEVEGEERAVPGWASAAMGGRAGTGGMPAAALGTVDVR